MLATNLLNYVRQQRTLIGIYTDFFNIILSINFLNQKIQLQKSPFSQIFWLGWQKTANPNARGRSTLTFLISSKVWISGLRPPWTQRNCWFMSAARGRQSNASMQASYTRSVYFILPKSYTNWVLIFWKESHEIPYWNKGIPKDF